MEVERVTVKVKIGGISVEATAALDFREGRTKEDAAAAAYNLSRALQDSLEARTGSAAALPDNGWDDLRGGGGHHQAGPTATVAAPPGWCAGHKVQMKQQTNERGSWWSHRAPDGSWCKGS